MSTQLRITRDGGTIRGHGRVDPAGTHPPAPPIRGSHDREQTR